jgi:hypothetical protein
LGRKNILWTVVSLRPHVTPMFLIHLSHNYLFFQGTSISSSYILNCDFIFYLYFLFFSCVLTFIFSPLAKSAFPTCTVDFRLPFLRRLLYCFFFNFLKNFFHALTSYLVHDLGTNFYTTYK